MKIIAVIKENERVWAELACELWQDNSVQDMLAELGNGGEECFLYMENDRALAFINLSLRYDYVEGTDSSPVGYIEGIYVKQEYRNRGIALKLLEFAKEWAKNKGCTELASDCELENESSQRFHKSVGFEEVNKIVCFKMKI